MLALPGSCSKYTGASQPKVTACTSVHGVFVSPRGFWWHASQLLQALQHQSVRFTDLYTGKLVQSPSCSRLSVCSDLCSAIHCNSVWDCIQQLVWQRPLCWDLGRHHLYYSATGFQATNISYVSWGILPSDLADAAILSCGYNQQSQPQL